MSLITVAEAKGLLPGLDPGGSGDDSLLTAMISALGAAFARYCGYPATTAGASPTMEQATYTRYQDGPGGRDLVLEVWPVGTITSIEDDPTEDFDGSTYLVANADYTLRSPNRGLVKLKSTATHGAWSEGKGSIKAVYQGGFATITEEIKHLAKMGVKNWHQLRANQGKASVSGDGGESFRDEEFLPLLVRRGLAPFRLPRVLL